MTEPTVALEGQQQVLRATFPGIRDSVKELVGKHMDSLAQKFVRNHDMKVKEELERLLKEYGKLKEPWVFEMKDLKHLTTCRKHRGYRSQQRDDCSESVALSLFDCRKHRHRTEGSRHTSTLS
jgi:hypothetical protein